MMDTTKLDGGYQNISQRVVFSYRSSLSQWFDQAQEDALGDSQRELHSFFRDLYDCMFYQPELFGMPVTEDCCINDNEPNEKDKKQAVKAALKKPKDIATQGMDFLYLAGKEGQLDGQDLVLPLETCAAYIKRSKSSKKFLQGLEGVGLAVTTAANCVVLHNDRYPKMMLALKILAEGCARYTGENERLGSFLFARCDFRADGVYRPDAMELYRIFTPAELEHITQLHDYFMQRGFTLEYQISDIFSWEVKYQGNKKIKATPLFQIEYQDRYRTVLRMQIKCASTNRIAELIPNQPRMLQDDFFRRVFRCKGDDCGWCRNQKTLGPSVIMRDGTPETVCWYSFSDVHGIDAETVTLIEQYAAMHDQLLPTP